MADISIFSILEKDAADFYHRARAREDSGGGEGSF